MALDMQQPKVRKPYVIQKSRELWSDEEHELFEQLLKSSAHAQCTPVA
jgi:hypothetical protein